MNFEDSRIFKVLYEAPFHKVATRLLDLSESGREINQRDSGGRTYLHHVALQSDKFSHAQAAPVAYQLALAGIDLNAKDDEGDTVLHKLTRYNFTHRLFVALVRCGADLSETDCKGRTVENILTQNQGPPTSNPLLFWYEQFKPGLIGAALSGDVQTTERLLKSWCRTRYWRNGKRYNLIQQIRETENVPNKAEILALLEKYQHTCELAISVLAGSTKRVSNVLQKSGANIDTADVSYTYHYPNSPRIPQPLIAAAWEQDNYDLIDLMMTYKPDTSRVWYNHRWKQPIPIFFHALLGKPKPNKISITNRIIRSSDLIRTNEKGQTILFCAIKDSMPIAFIRGLIKYGVDITARDYIGSTARDLAKSLFQEDCVETLDKHVLETLQNRDLKELDRYVTRGYGQTVLEIVGSKKLQMALGLQHDLAEKMTMRPVQERLATIPSIEKRMTRAYDVVCEGNLLTLSRLVTTETCCYQNFCGQTLLHWAVLKCNHEAMQWLVSNFPQLRNVCDNLLRSPLHYAVSIYGMQSLEVKILNENGSSWEITDTIGRTPREYAEEVLGTIDHEDLKRAIINFYTNVYVSNTDFGFRLKTAVTTGSRSDVEKLISESARNNIDLGFYSELLFDCIDMHRPGTAMFLMDQGASPDVYARYEACNPDDEACLEKRCRHPIVSLQERAEELGYEPVARFIDQVKSGQNTPLSTAHSHQRPCHESANHSASTTRDTARSGLSTPFSQMANFGTFM